MSWRYTGHTSNHRLNYWRSKVHETPAPVTEVLVDDHKSLSLHYLSTRCRQKMRSSASLKPYIVVVLVLWMSASRNEVSAVRTHRVNSTSRTVAIVGMETLFSHSVNLSNRRPTWCEVRQSRAQRCPSPAVRHEPVDNVTRWHSNRSPHGRSRDNLHTAAVAPTDAAAGRKRRMNDWMEERTDGWMEYVVADG
jgi:hypothetical protein